MNDHPNLTGPGLAGTECLVLGAGGFIGLNLCRALSVAGASVRGYGRASAFPGALPPLRWISAEFSDRSMLTDALEGVDTVFHLLGASIPAHAERDPADDLRTNVAASVELLRLCRTAGVRRIVYISSGGTVYGVPRSLPISETHPTDPISAYGIHKLLMEKHLGLQAYRYGMRVMVLRASNPYGPFQIPDRGQGLIATLIQRRLSRRPVEIWGDGRIVRDFLHIDDLVDAMLRAAIYEGSHGVLNVGSGIGRSVLDVVASVDKVLDTKGAEILYRPGRAVDVPANVLDVALTQRELGWVPRTEWMLGLRGTAEWIASTCHPALLTLRSAGPLT
ncbi:NAD-dependent epimerase/dehydratase family protein [Belnapia sp. T18]|uniref:NAD-dependent epimerase/dehydratase family protein n=1 Tax=Belnapia arida TaxID=2804533 RepID=A0ABS1UFX4_9PROT|nr:NAD-dependent epimerase/dehydratase family protein [Belnapia arida]MBL6082181.1 NAD-dependent epimerase/dehydratase family protein [Belnapia arida]